MRWLRWFVGLVLCVQASGVRAVTLSGLDEFGQLHGRYAPGGDCTRTPRITVDRAGFGFEVGTQALRADRPEYAASFAGPAYEGSSLWFFPWFSESGPNPLLLVFNAGEKPGVLVVEAADHGHPGMPPLSPAHRALVQGSPYLRCR